MSKLVKTFLLFVVFNFLSVISARTLSYAYAVTEQDLKNYISSAISHNGKVKKLLLNRDQNRKTDLETFVDEVLNLHNLYRAKHDTPILTLDPVLNQLAQDWAEKLVRNRVLEHSLLRIDGEFLGENLAAKKNGTLTAQQCVDAWYNEIKEYKFESPKLYPAAAHFTQVVWKSSEKLGVGFYEEDNYAVCVALYNPAGNQIDAFRENVLPLVEDDSVRGGSATALSGENVVDARQKALALHNELRAKHGAIPLVLDDELNDIAQQYAEYLRGIQQMVHSDNKFRGDYMGENLATSPSDQLTVEQCVQMWYDEIQKYNWNNPVFDMETGHFTQVVWKNSKQLGFGYASSPEYTVCVANYYPAGNYEGEFGKNVLPLGTKVTGEGNEGGDDSGFTWDTESDGAGGGPEGEDDGPIDHGDDNGTPGVILEQSAELDKIEAFRNDLLRTQNAYRTRHAAPPMTLSPELSALAQSLAEKLRDSRQAPVSILEFGGLDNSNLGANYAIGLNKYLTAQECVDAWYKEGENYNFREPGFSTETGHFTQVIWRASRLLGVGYATTDNGYSACVALYDPAGNKAGEFRENVRRQLLRSDQ